MKQTKLISLFYLLLLIILLSCILCFYVLNTNVAFAETIRIDKYKEVDATDQLTCDTIEKELIIVVNDDNYNINDDVTIVQLKIKREYEISYIEFLNNSNNNQYEILKNGFFNILIKKEYNYNCSIISFKIYTELAESIEAELFVFENAQGVFFSFESQNKAKEEWINYIASNGLVSNETEKIIRNLISNNSLKLNDELFKYSDSIYKNNIKSRGNKDTYVSGIIKWTTNNNRIIPIRQALVEVYDRNLDIFGDTLLGSTVSDNYGNYSIVFQNNDSVFDNHGSDIYIKIYAGDGNIEVRGVTLSADHQESRYSVNTRYKTINDVSTGASYTIDETITMIDDLDHFRELACQAIQIFQAALVARDFATTQLGYLPDSVDIWYPWNSNGCYYDAFSDAIYIPYLRDDDYSQIYTYESWDVIMHEYGHFIQYQIGLQSIWADIQSFIENGNTSDHFSDTNDANLYGKDVGIKLAWAESWPTIFGFIAQKEYPYTISSIPTVADSYYTSYNGSIYNIETTDIRLGEACERSIMAILWDLYDSNNESNDNINLTASEWWNITTVGGTYTFSAFVQNFYDEYPDLENDLGANLAYYKMCASNLAVNFTSNPSSAPTISWSNYSGWDNYPLTTVVYAVNEDETTSFIIAYGDTLTCLDAMNQTQWNAILNWSGRTFKIKMFSAQSEPPTTGTYGSQLYVIQKPLFTVVEVGNNCEITGSYFPLSGSVLIPSEYFGKTVTSISSNAFSGQTGITSIDIPSSITSIGSYAFNNCTNLTSVYYSSASQVTSISDYTFYNCPISSLSWPNASITSIGSYAFYGNNLSTINIASTTTYVGDNAFGNSNNLTIYSAADDTNWASTWNSSNRPYFKECVFSGGGGYLISFNKTDTNPGSLYSGTINNPTRSGYTFDKWYINADFTGDYYTMANLSSAPNRTLYAKWNSNSSGGSCITAGSLITLADGTQTAVENLTGNEQLLVWDMLNGTFTSAPILFIDSEITTTYDVITLTFSDGTQVEVIDEHAFFDTTLNKYVFLRSDAAQYIGHWFKKQSYDINNNMMLVNVQLMDVSISQQVTTAYSPVTYGHLCYYVNGMLSMPGNTESFINIFDVDAQTMAYDQTSMAQDISIYGLYTYEEFSNIIPIPELVFNAFNGQYLKVAIGKGITTLQEIQNLLNRYMSFFE